MTPKLSLQRNFSIYAQVALAAALTLAPQLTVAQQARHPFRIGVLNEAQTANHPTVEGLRSGLREIGLEDGREITFDIRFTEGNLQALPGKATELVDKRVDLIFTSGDAAIHAAYNASEKIPIVFTQVGDGVLPRLPQIGHNVREKITGISSLNVRLAPKRLEIMKTLVPTIRRIVAIYPASDVSTLAVVQETQKAGPGLKLEIASRPVFGAEDVRRVLKTVGPGDAFLVPDNDTLDIPSAILEMSLMSRIPAVFPTALWVSHGGLVSYGPDYYSQGVQAARLVAKILQGARPQDLPVEGAEKIDLAISLKTAALLRVNVPRKVLLRADRIYR
jgi:putative tryptophan/tyrosine transport system substrate-binding protein